MTSKSGTASLEVLEERVGSLAVRVGDAVDAVKSNSAKLDKVIALEVKQSELHNDVRTLMSEMASVRDAVNGQGQRFTSEMNGVGGRVAEVDARLGGKIATIETVQATHGRNFRIVAGFITGTFVTGLAIIGWLFNRLYEGIIGALQTH